MLQVTVLVGDPIELDDIINQSSRQCLSKEAVYDAITVRVGERMRVMKAELDELVLTQRSEENATLEQRGVVIGRAENLLQYIDWESQGLLLDDGLEVSETFNLTSALKSSTTLHRESHSILRGKELLCLSCIPICLRQVGGCICVNSVCNNHLLLGLKYMNSEAICAGGFLYVEEFRYSFGPLS
jgi:hypothetical protein